MVGARSDRWDRSHGERVSRFTDVSSALAVHSDRQLGALVEQASILGSGIGGTSVRCEVGGVPVFAKRIPLCDLERRAENNMSTANLFRLPPFFQYGVGSPGFGAWRELAANVMTTNWVLAGRSAAFPLLYHWRVLPGGPPPAEEHADVEAGVRYWGGSSAVRERLQALARASASIVLFQEFIPHTLDDWLATQLTAGLDAVTAACTMVESCLLTDVPFMNTHGLMHFDAHFGNVLTDGRRLYLADFGLATSSRFALSSEETIFLRRNRTHDLGYALMRLVNWLVTNVSVIAASAEAVPGQRDVSGQRDDPGQRDDLAPRNDLLQRNEYIRACAAGAEPTGSPPGIATMIRRYAPAAAVMNDFYADLFRVDRATPYPQQIERTLAAIQNP